MTSCLPGWPAAARCRLRPRSADPASWPGGSFAGQTRSRKLHGHLRSSSVLREHEVAKQGDGRVRVPAEPGNCRRDLRGRTHLSEGHAGSGRALHRRRRHVAGLTDVTLISGGNDETDGNVQLVRRRDGYSVDGHLVEIHPEIGVAASSDVMPGTGCAALAAERPQLVVTNLMVASAMLNCLWAVTEQGSVPYSEVYLDVVHNAARSRSWFRVPASTP